MPSESELKQQALAEADARSEELSALIAKAMEPDAKPNRRTNK